MSNAKHADICATTCQCANCIAEHGPDGSFGFIMLPTEDGSGPLVTDKMSRGEFQRFLVACLVGTGAEVDADWKDEDTGLPIDPQVTH